ncbi:hypothetical protein SISNIDRAFT_471258 [Sistotremastrum niveocremeum HHB9708]|uniref:Uncharacterized protein n=1 Tax=Sistotremastrum niveocremeum HHB9708 TaxID=1314777 RepID=A0A164MVT4_9AGAM|nr:hypothetical protein SISNIDRAFT_471258 [Sistotremastrum niveocremeum HHB9708]
MDAHHVPVPQYKFRKLGYDEAQPIREERLRRCLQVLQDGYDPFSDIPESIKEAWKNRKFSKELDGFKHEAIAPFVQGDVYKENGELMLLDSDPVSTARYCQLLIVKRCLARFVSLDAREQIISGMKALTPGAKRTSSQDAHLVMLQSMGPIVSLALLDKVEKYFPTCSYVLDVSPVQPAPELLAYLYSCHSSLLAEALARILLLWFHTCSCSFPQYNVVSHHQKLAQVIDHSRSSSGSHNSVKDGWSTSSPQTHSRQASSSTVATEMSVHQMAKADQDPRAVLAHSELGAPAEQLNQRLNEVQLDTKPRGTSASKSKPAKRG